MPHLALHVQQIGVIADRVDRIRIAKLMRGQMAYFGPLAKLGQVLPHPPGSEARPSAPAMGDKQGIESGWQGQPSAGFEPAAHVPGRGLVKNNSPILVGLATSDKGAAVVFLNKDITSIERGQFGYPQAGIKRQRPQSQGAYIQPMTPALAGYGFEVAKELLQFLTPRSAGQQFGVWRSFCQLNRIGRQLAALVEPRQPDFERLVIAFDAAFFEAAPFTVVQKIIDRFGCGRKVAAGIGAELVERGFVIEDRLRGLARLRLQELLNGPVKMAGAIGLNKG